MNAVHTVSIGKKVKSMSTFPLSFIIIRLIVESRLSGFLRKFNEFSKGTIHIGRQHVLGGRGADGQKVTVRKNQNSPS